MSKEIEIDLGALEAEIGNLDEAAVREQLMAIRTRQKTQQLRNANKGSQKKYQAIQREKARLLKELAIKKGFYEEINEAAMAKAKSVVEAEAVADEAEETATA